MMHFSTFSAIASIPFMLKDFVVPSFKQAVLLLLIGVFGSLGQAFIAYAYRFAPASEISIYNYSGIIFSMIAGADERTCARAESRHVFYPVFGVPGQAPDALHSAQTRMAEYAKLLAKNAQIDCNLI